jgi:hypothetical protein
LIFTRLSPPPKFRPFVLDEEEESRMDHTLDAQTLADRLKCEQKEYWMHLEAASSLEKYPGMYT